MALQSEKTRRDSGLAIETIPSNGNLIELTKDVSDFLVQNFLTNDLLNRVYSSLKLI